MTDPSALSSRVERSHRVRGTVAFASLTCLLILAGYFQVWTWGLGDAWTFKPDFADTAAILAAGEAQEAGLHIYGKNPLDPYWRPHVYGPGWLVTGTLGLTVADAHWLGWVLAGAFVLTAALLLAPRTRWEVAAALALVCSPPVILGVGRGNNDLVVFILLAATAWLLLRPRPVFVLLGHVLVGTAALLKLYPAVATAVLLLERSRRPANEAGTGRWPWLPRRELILGFSATVAGCGLAVLASWAHFRQVFDVIPNPPTIFAYGFQVVRTTGELMHYPPSLMVGWACGFFLVATLLYPQRRMLWTALPQDAFACHAFASGALAWLFCYLTIASFPYRLVLVLLAVRYWFVLRREPATRRLGTIQLTLWILVAWVHVPKGIWSDLAITPLDGSLDAWAGFFVVAGFEQGLMLALSLALAVTVVGLFSASLRARLPVPATAP